MEKLKQICAEKGIRIFVGLKNLSEFYIWHCLANETIYVDEKATDEHAEEFMFYEFGIAKAGVGA